MPRFHTRDNTSIYYKDWGTGRPVILIHGWPLSADSWDEVAMELVKRGLRTIMYDRKGFGRSDQPWSGYDYDSLTDDLNDLIHHLQLSQVSLVGFSMGGGEVVRYLSKHGASKIRSAVLVGSIIPFLLQTSDHPAGVPQAVFDQIQEGITADRHQFFADFFKGFYGVGFLSRPVSTELLEWSRMVAAQASLKATLDCVTSFSATDFRRELASMAVPTLVIHGTEDQTVPIDITSRPAAAGIPGARLVEYEGAPHGLFATHRQRLVQDLLEFLV